MASTGRYKVVVFSGAPSGTVAVSVTPVNIQKVYWIVNESSQAVTLSNGTGSTLTVAAATTAPAFCDGNGNVIGLQAGNSTFSSIMTTGNITDGGTLIVAGSTNLNGGLNVVGNSGFNGNIGFTGSLTGGTGNVAIGSSALVTLPVGADILINSAVPLPTYIQSIAIPTFSNVGVTGGTFIIAIYGTGVGTRVAIAHGSGVLANGNTIALPAGFSASNTVFSVALNTINTLNTAQPLSLINCSVTGGGAITMTASDNNSHNFTGTCNWQASCYATGY